MEVKGQNGLNVKLWVGTTYEIKWWQKKLATYWRVSRQLCKAALYTKILNASIFL